MHANSAREALLKVCTLPLLAGGAISPAFVLPTVAGCLDLVVHLAVDPDGRRRVREIVGVPGRVEGGVVETSEVFGTRDGRLVRGAGVPPRADRFERLGLDLGRLLDPAA